MKFQNPSIHHSKVNTQTDTQTDRQAESHMPFQLFQSWGHKNIQANLMAVGQRISLNCSSLYFDIQGIVSL